MAQGSNDLLGDQNLATAVTMLAFGQAGGSTGGNDSGINHFVMAQSSGFICNIAVTTMDTGIGSISLFRAGGACNDRCVTMLCNGYSDPHLFAGIAKPNLSSQGNGLPCPNAFHILWKYNTVYPEILTKQI